jgi:hypothetical protein
MSVISLIVGAGNIDRIIQNADDLLLQYRKDSGYRYLDFAPQTPSDKIMPEDLAVTLLMNSRVDWRAFCSIQDHGQTIELSKLPLKSLEQTSIDDRKQIATVITSLAKYPGIAASVATKLLHKKRPALIPILDNQAIFGAYMNPNWSQEPALRDSVRDENLIRSALDWIAFDLNRPENVAVWDDLLTIEPRRTRIQLFDCVWWMYFRKIQPVKRRTWINLKKEESK